MPPRIEDYALLGDTHTSALVSREGSIDWLCLPRFDSAAIFAALLGDAYTGRWQIAPDGSVHALRRRYRGDTLVLETDFDTSEGSIRLVRAALAARGSGPCSRPVPRVRGRARPRRRRHRAGGRKRSSLPVRRTRVGAGFRSTRACQPTWNAYQRDSVRGLALVGAPLCGEPGSGVQTTVAPSDGVPRNSEKGSPGSLQ